MRPFPRSILLAVAALVPSVLAAQGVTVQSTTDSKFYGAMGTIVNLGARMSGTSMHAIPSTSYITGHRMRSDSENSGMIIDADAGRFTQIDHKNKTFTTMTFAEMAAAMEQAQQSARANAQKEKAKAANDPKAPKGDMNVKYKVAVDRPGQHERIAGYDTERLFLTITLEGEATPEGEKTQQVGSMVFFIDQWMSKDAPQIAAVREFDRAYAAKFGQAFREQAAGLQAAFASDPRLKEGMEAAGKELQKVPGISLRSVTYVALVPNDMTFDRNLVLADASSAAKDDKAAKKDEKPKGGGFKGLMGAIKSAAEENNKSSSDKNAPPPPPKQATMMAISSEVNSINTGPVPSSMFDPPTGYREVKPRTP